MKKLLSEHPYAVVSAVFLVLLVFGFLYLDWRKDDFMFMLLLYFIVTLSIRLDDISRQIGSDRQTASDRDETVLSTLREIRSALRESNLRLKGIQDSMQQDHDT